MVDESVPGEEQDFEESPGHCVGDVLAAGVDKAHVEWGMGPVANMLV